ncbi:hypothetical protein [Halorussus pelagicus]|uniref:hypothetical protein n=1 Tax=Halorussus pelagicus TaxID=2505977 RepID=UPI000FFBDC31|nr:hypothetical protein [Halorussus pelagicus]
MIYSRTALQKGAVVLSRGLAFALVVVFVWWIFVRVPQFAYIWYLNPGDGHSQTVNPYVFTFFYFQIPVRVSFYIAIGARILLVTREYFQFAQGYLIPPYPVHQLPDKELPVAWREAQEPIQKKFRNFIRAFGLALVLMVSIDIFHVRWLQWNSESIAELLRRLPADILLGSISFVLSAPIQQFGVPFTADMNSVTLVGNLFLVWIPVVPLVIGFLNLNSLLYDIIEESLFWIGKGAGSQFRKVRASMRRVFER